jgi:hypothetical protein
VRTGLRVIETEIVIEARPEAVWAKLMDFESYPDWNPFITQISGEPRVGEVLTVMIRPSGSSPMKFTPTVAEVEENRLFVWLGSFIFKGLFDGRHEFALEPIEGERTRFIHRETFSGILSMFFMLAIAAKTRQGFQDMNADLKRRVEED